MARSSREIFSVFGTCEAVAAELMVSDGRAIKIPADQIPETASHNVNGDRARFAVSIERRHVYEFEQLIRDMRM